MTTTTVSPTSDGAARKMTDFDWELLPKSVAVAVRSWCIHNNFVGDDGHISYVYANCAIAAIEAYSKLPKPEPVAQPEDDQECRYCGCQYSGKTCPVCKPAVQPIPAGAAIPPLPSTLDCIHGAVRTECPSCAPAVDEATDETAGIIIRNLSNRIATLESKLSVARRLANKSVRTTNGYWFCDCCGGLEDSNKIKHKPGCDVDEILGDGK